MALSGLFGKKKAKEPEARRSASSDAARSDDSKARSRNQSGSSSSTRRGPTTKSPPTLSPQDVARATAEKIDLIESQIESEIMQSRTDPYVSRTTNTTRIDQTRTSLGKTGISAATMTGQSTDILLGDSRLANSMELSEIGRAHV